MMEIALLIGIVTATGAFLGSMLGLGGGFLIVPLLTILIKLPIKTATALSLLSIVANSQSASTVYASKKVINFRIGLILETLAMIGAILGANINLMIDEATLSLIFALVLPYVSYKMLKGNGAIKEKKENITTKNLLKGLIYAFFAGIVSALLGIGGGILKIPILVLILSLPTRIAIGTSMFMVSITSVTGAYIYFSKNVINLLYGAYAVIGAFIGSQTGSRIGLKINVTILRKMFSIILILFSLIMILKVFGVWI